MQGNDNNRGQTNNIGYDLSSGNIAEAIQKIGYKLGLHVDEEGVLIEMVEGIVAGTINWDQFKTTVRGRFGLNDDEQKYLLEEVEKNVLAPIKSQMHAQFEQHEAEKEAADAAEIAQSKPVNPYRNADPYREPIE